MQDDLTVTCPLEDAAGIFHLIAQPDRIDDLSIMRHRQRSAVRNREQRLHIFHRISSGRRIPYMPDGDIARQIIQPFSGEHLRDEPPSFLALHSQPIADRYAASFLSAVLQRMQPIIRQLSGMVHMIDPEYAALFMQFIKHRVIPSFPFHGRMLHQTAARCQSSIPNSMRSSHDPD